MESMHVKLKTPTGVGNMAGSLSKPCSIVSQSPSLSILYSALTPSLPSTV